MSFPHYAWNASINLFAGLNELGVPTALDPNSGDVAGASYLPVDLDPVTQTRSTARHAYFDSVVNRPNLWVATEQTVTQLLFDGEQGNKDASTPVTKANSLGQGTMPGTMDGIFGDGSVLNITSLPPDHPPSRIGLIKRNLIDAFWSGLKAPTKLFRKQTAAPSSPTLIVTGVEFAPNAQSKRQTVRATR